MGGGLLDVLVQGGAAAGGKFFGVALLVHTLRKFVEFGCNFLAGRHDVRQQRVDDLDIRLSASLAKRLEHLEAIEKANQVEIGRLRRAVEILATELRNRGGADDKLQQVASLLSGPFGVDFETPDDMIGTLGRIK